MNEILFSTKMYNKNADSKRDMNTILSKLQQDDKILAELDNKLRSSSKRTYLDDDHFAESTEKYSSLPSLNSYGAGEWKPTSNNNEQYDGYRKERAYNSSTSNKATDNTELVKELKRIEDSLASVRSESRDYNKMLDSVTSKPRKDRDLEKMKPLISTKHSTKIDSYVTADKINALLDNKKTSQFTSKELDLEQLMEKLAQDNKILAELDKKLQTVSTSGSTEPTTRDQLSSSLPSLNTSNLKSSMLPRSSATSSYLNHTKPNVSSGCTSQLSRPQTSIASHPSHPFNSQLDELKQAEDIVDSIEIPNRGRCKVFIARYNYDPYKQSPNENPEAEVTLLAGDFILVYSTLDEDGFYNGELLDGRRGLVPSNFVEKLTGEDLFEFQASVLYGHNREAESDTASFPPEFYDAILNETLGHTNFQHLLAPDDFHRINDYIDLEDATEIDEECSDMERAETDAAKTTVPPPQRLILERQLHKSVLIGWLHPECPRTMMDHYQIYVDGVLKATIPTGDRTKALVEGVDSSMPHRISVRAVDRNGRFSRDPGCTIVIGKTIPFAPCCVKAANITSDSALISWIPCNSNFYHVVAVNSVEVRTVRPSIYKHLITGLAANTLYRVSVRAKPGKLLCSDEKNPKKLEMLTTFVDFRTLPKSLPDPPVDIQVESGPQEGTLLVTWLPITLNQFGTSNNCPVTGYAVFAGHKKLAEIDSPTGDHALLNIGSLEYLHKKQITVRTKSGENLSQDSMPCQIPDDLLKLPQTNNPNLVTKRNLNYDLRHKMINNRQANFTHNIRAGNRMTKSHQNMSGGHHGMLNDNMTRISIPAIEITKETPSESVHPAESYSEEEFDASMKHRVHGPYHKRSGISPLPPQRTRVISEFERSNFGPFNMGLSHRRPHSQRDREHGVRWFVALFDYDPLSMSPNPDAAEEELPFQEGQLIKIFGDKDADGFYRGEANGRMGYVPCNMVSEVQYDVENDPRFRNNPNDPWGHLPIRKMIALYDYDPQELSPNPDSEMELPFRTGEIIFVYGDMDEDGFFMGELNGVRGLVPSNFLSEATQVEPPNLRHGKLLLNQQQQQLQQQQQQQHQMQLQQQMRPINPSNLGLAHSQGLMQGQSQVQMQQQQQQQYNQRFAQPGQNYDQSVQTAMFPNQTQMSQSQPQQQQQQFQFQGNQGTTGANQMYQNQGIFQPQSQQTGQQLPLNQSFGRGMRQQNPMLNTTHQTQGQYSTMFQGSGTGIGNKQRPTSLDLNTGTPRFGQQMGNQPFANQLQAQQSNQLQAPGQQQPQQQQQSTGMLGSLFASGKKILEEATTPLGARGPFAHPNQPHQTMMGHLPHQQVQQQPQQQMSQMQQPQQTMNQFGQQQPFNPMVPGQANPQGGTILNTMKNIFKL